MPFSSTIFLSSCGFSKAGGPKGYLPLNYGT
jgi:hypothetical protein